MTALRGTLERVVNHIWYERSLFSHLLLPLAAVVRLIVSRRRKSALPKGATPEGIKVIIVGGLTVGGTGKTPIVIALGRWLQQRGLRVGVLSRGYRSDVRDIPRMVSSTDKPSSVGDEPLLIFKALQAPVVVCRDRLRGLDALTSQASVDVVLSDDGLQHYPLPRDLEILVLDAERGLGNGRVIPAGPLREPASRLGSVDWVLIRNSDDPDRAFTYRIIGVREWSSGRLIPWLDCVAKWRGLSVTAMTGLGQPMQFFEMLRREGLRVESVALPDHEPITKADLGRVSTDLVLITAKDAIKLSDIEDSQATHRLWVVEIEAALPSSLLSSLESVLSPSM
jgi:tetraacyldisaccharide 4'-kinase